MFESLSEHWVAFALWHGALSWTLTTLNIGYRFQWFWNNMNYLLFNSKSLYSWWTNALSKLLEDLFHHQISLNNVHILFFTIVCHPSFTTMQLSSNPFSIYKSRTWFFIISNDSSHLIDNDYVKSETVVEKIMTQIKLTTSGRTKQNGLHLYVSYLTQPSLLIESLTTSLGPVFHGLSFDIKFIGYRSWKDNAIPLAKGYAQPCIY